MDFPGHVAGHIDLGGDIVWGQEFYTGNRYRTKIERFLCNQLSIENNLYLRKEKTTTEQPQGPHSNWARGAITPHFFKDRSKTLQILNIAVTDL